MEYNYGKLSPETEKIMSEHFEKDNVIALATTENGRFDIDFTI